MKILICDDDPIYANDIYHNVKSIFSENQIQTEVEIFNDSENPNLKNTSYDIAFLDVEMQPFDGIETARKLKSTNKNIIIFFITSYDKYLDKAMDINAFRFIKKPLDTTRLKIGIEKAIKYIDNTNISFYVKYNNDIITVSSSDIVYIEIVGRNTKVVFEDMQYISSNSLKFWENKLIASYYYKIHKSFIINTKFITKYSRNMVQLCGKYEVPVSYRKQAKFRTFFFNNIGE